MELKEKYDNWYHSTMFLSVGNFEHPTWKEFVDECKKDELATIDFFIELLEKTTHAVHALDEVFPHTMEYVGYVPLKDACRTWLIVLKSWKELI